MCECDDRNGRCVIERFASICNDAHVHARSFNIPMVDLVKMIEKWCETEPGVKLNQKT